MNNINRKCSPLECYINILMGLFYKHFWSRTQLRYIITWFITPHTKKQNVIQCILIRVLKVRLCCSFTVTHRGPWCCCSSCLFSSSWQPCHSWERTAGSPCWSTPPARLYKNWKHKRTHISLTVSLPLFISVHIIDFYTQSYLWVFSYMSRFSFCTISRF